MKTQTPAKDAPAAQRTEGSQQRVVRAPDWILIREGITQREWRIKKRRHLKELIKALNEYRMGCAYCPNKNGEVSALDALLKSMWESHKESRWPWRSNTKSSNEA